MATLRHITLSIDSSLENVPLIGTAVNRICSLTPLSEVEAYQTELCVVEACNNAIKHAYENKSGNLVEVEVHLGINHITFDICDKGKVMKMRDTPNLDYDIEDLNQVPEGGMGLFIIHSVMDEVNYGHIHGRNVLRLARFFELDKKKSRSDQSAEQLA
ncbi:MAG: ATP-binding protein [Calditrichota bacterium]